MLVMVAHNPDCADRLPLFLSGKIESPSPLLHPVQEKSSKGIGGPK